MKKGTGRVETAGLNDTQFGHKGDLRNVTGTPWLQTHDEAREEGIKRLAKGTRQDQEGDVTEPRKRIRRGGEGDMTRLGRESKVRVSSSSPPPLTSPSWVCTKDLRIYI